MVVIQVVADVTEEQVITVKNTGKPKCPWETCSVAVTSERIVSFRPSDVPSNLSRQRTNSPGAQVCNGTSGNMTSLEADECLPSAVK